MLTTALHLIPYALVAALSPLGFAAVVAVMGSGRLKALVFGVSFVVAQLLTCVLALLVGASFTRHQHAHPTFQAILELLFGLALLAAALQFRRRPPAPPNADGPSRSQAVLERLRRLRFGTALLAGALLGIGGPKRLVLTFLAAATIGSAGLGSSSEELALAIFYTGVATVLVWFPISFFVLAGDRVVRLFASAQQQARLHQRAVTFWPIVVLGLALIADALVRLVT